MEDVLPKLAKLVRIDLDQCMQAKRLHGIEKIKRDLIIYLLWNKGLMTNDQIGKLFNISYSAVSHNVKKFKEEIAKNKKLRIKFDRYNSQFKL